jgi:succinylglutamate desuccinylase
VAVVTLRVLDSVPEALLDVDVRHVADVVPQPTLIHLAGQRQPALFVSALLHGDESVGLVAIQRLLREHDGHPLPRALSLFIGNVSAASAGVRRLPQQPDFNRVWPGTDLGACEEVQLMREVTDAMRRRGVFASLDLHNNSGLNPRYACVNDLAAPFLQLATLFSRTVVHFREPRGVQSAAFAAFCPAVALECGRAGDAEGEARAAAVLDALLHLAELPQHAPTAADIDLFHTVAIVKVPPETTLSFDGSAADLVFREDLDHLNFSELESGTVLAQVPNCGGAPLLVPGDADTNRWQEFFEVRGDQLTLRTPLMPAMLTRSVAAVRQDCLCYLMERLAPPR